MKTTTTAQIIATARGTEILLPILTGQQSPVEWAKAIAKDSVTTKNGREISAARSALNGAQFAMTNIALAMRSATELGRLPFTQAVKETKRIYTALDTLRTAFAGVRNEAHRELTVAEVTLEVKDGVFDGLQSQNDEPYSEEELRDMGISWEDIEEILQAQAVQRSMGQSHLMDSDGSMSEDEGEYRTSIHDATQLWDIELKDIRYSESSAAAVALIGMQWPTHNPMWDALLDRLADAWQASIEYADDKAAAAAKIERREQVLEDLHAKPMMARWVVNHVTRRVFRDIEALKLKAEDVQTRWDWAERQAMNEERYGVPAYTTRRNMGEHVELERKAFLFYQELNEAELGEGSAYAVMNSEGVTLRATMATGMSKAHKDGDVNQWATMMDAHEENLESALERDRRWYTAQLEAIEGLIVKLQPLYQELRQMDLNLAKLWELFTDGERPAQPPIYWNMERAFLAGEEQAARDAIRIEAAMAKQKAREAEGDALVKAAAIIEAMGL
jgi:hypothetical protein